MKRMVSEPKTISIPPSVSSSEIKIAMMRAMLPEGTAEASGTLELLRAGRTRVFEFIQKLLANEGLSDQIADFTIEPTPEFLDSCLKRLKSDYGRGIVVVDNLKTVKDFQIALAEDKTAGTPWETIQGRLLANDSALLKKAARRLQGGGELIGVYPNGKLCIKDRGTEPVIFGTVGDGRKITITNDCLYKDYLMEHLNDEGQFANYWEIREAVYADGFELPPDQSDYDKKGFLAATEALTGLPFIMASDGQGWRAAILECGDAPGKTMNAIHFNPKFFQAYISTDYPELRFAERGAMRLLRG